METNFRLYSHPRTVYPTGMLEMTALLRWSVYSMARPEDMSRAHEVWASRGSEIPDRNHPSNETHSSLSPIPESQSRLEFVQRFYSEDEFKI
jgi:hypothetical protein